MDKKNYETVVFSLKYFKNDIVTTSDASSLTKDTYYEGAKGMDDIFE